MDCNGVKLKQKLRDVACSDGNKDLCTLIGLCEFRIVSLSSGMVEVQFRPDNASDLLHSTWIPALKFDSNYELDLISTVLCFYFKGVLKGICINRLDWRFCKW